MSNINGCEFLNYGIKFSGMGWHYWSRSSGSKAMRHIPACRDLHLPGWGGCTASESVPDGEPRRSLLPSILQGKVRDSMGFLQIRSWNSLLRLTDECFICSCALSPLGGVRDHSLSPDFLFVVVFCFFSFSLHVLASLAAWPVPWTAMKWHLRHSF